MREPTDVGGAARRRSPTSSSSPPSRPSGTTRPGGRPPGSATPSTAIPADLHVYQELLAELRPGLVVLAGDDDGLGGRALFVASICDQLGHGRVVAVGRWRRVRAARATRASPTCAGPPEDAAVAAEVAALAPDAAERSGDPRPRRRRTGSSPPSSATRRWSRSAATSWSRTPWSTGGRSGSGFGAGTARGGGGHPRPHRRLRARPGGERYTVTFNRSGYLKRVRA